MRRCKHRIMYDDHYHYYLCSRTAVVDGYCKQHAASRERKKRLSAADPRARIAALEKCVKAADIVRDDSAREWMMSVKRLPQWILDYDAARKEIDK